MKLVQISNTEIVNLEFIEVMKINKPGIWLGMASGASLFVEEAFVGSLWALAFPGMTKEP